LRFALAGLIVAVATAAAVAEPTVVEGTVTGQVTWQGEVHLLGQVTLSKAEVTVRPGSVIRLLPKGELVGELIIGRTYEDPVTLVLAGTAEEPIEFGGHADHPPAAIDMRTSRKARLEARHVRFHHLRSRRPLAPTATTTPAGQTQPSARPGITVHLEGPDAQFTLERCTIAACGPVHLAFLGGEPEFVIDDCRFVDEIEPVALQVAGTGGGDKTIRRNNFSAGVSVSTGDVTLKDNVLIGPHASISVWRGLLGVRVVGNYVHNTGDVADGRTCLAVHSPDTAVTDNVFRGGTYTVQRSPRRLGGNVFVAADALERPKVGPMTLAGRVPTHGLVTGLPAEAVVQHNIFVGPAWSMLRTGKGSTDVTITHNTFDGMNKANRAVHLNCLGARAASRADLRFNLFLRFTFPPIFDEANQVEAITRCDHNAYAPRPDSRFDNVVLPDAEDERQWLRHDRLLGDPAEVGLDDLPVSVELLPEEEQLRIGRTTPADVLAAWRNRYKPTSGLAAAEEDTFIGAIEP
jgi:hypothetical protein